MKTYLIIGIRITVLSLLLFGIIYPLTITGIAKIIGGNDGDGKQITYNGKIVGFEVIGQRFESPRYFQGRPSAVNYNAAATGGSNKGTNNKEYLLQVEDRINQFIKNNPDVHRQDIPVDLITASGGGLDPDISPQSALVQVSRIAKERNIKEEVLRRLITENTKRPLLGMLGPERVNVLKLNVALEELSIGRTNN